MLTISREADYAVRVMVHMAGASEERIQARTLAEAEHIPESFLLKILHTLTRSRLLRSFRGVRGGYQLAMDPANLTLFRLLEIMEGSLGLNVCVQSGVGCELQTRCAAHDVWAAAQTQLRQTLESVTFAQLAVRAASKAKKNSIPPD